ncbi:helix-turn-helix domain-containing protein [Halobacillus mangrovi]|uniref:HTH araC/xylS-type domain-containing protein n=1 Tax=Halobacillus mangrovi TaxID=402384 RepID=A0A1W5ZWV1_9BACI|nr:helix-turn-helix domain-containing protein [Halobacillus mangrovi]ARI77753.1 hypothetical protein HM131_13240 [Halobacillus mangrovi]
MINLFVSYTPKIMTSPYTLYEEYKPHPMLQPYVCCYWSSASKSLMERKEYISTVIPDGCTDIIIEYHDHDEDLSFRYCGIFEDHFMFKEDTSSTKKSFGIRFYPGTASLFVPQKAKETAQSITGLDHLAPQMKSVLQKAIQESRSVSDLIKACDNVLRKILSDALLRKNEDVQLQNILFQIISSRGMLSVKEISEREVIGRRRMQRMFDQVIGMSPKKFSQVIRFQSALSLWIDQSPTKKLNLPDDLDFYDQSHFVKDIKKRVGINPSSIRVSDFYNTDERGKTILVEDYEKGVKE